ncbi:Defective in cullin neddylation protein [Entamoeba marina]
MVSLMFHEPLTDASMIAFERYKCGKQLVGSQLDSLLYGFYHMYPCYQQFVNYLKLSRKTYYMTKDEWLSLYHEQEAVLNKGYVTPTRRLSWPCLLDEFVEYNESVWKMECEE